ncbi:MAG TPA: hypothetical protein PK079_16240 [Leptospiraceae bacterium]|nr:hypothetical protein [Leptospiraceae bacterium]HMW07051.1 hypothetical protein [Leptospiraceae bacterium]HMX32752.1 hypothetical protein [Leptospiraceae bacterium]HMY33856.1 hypothetical protein [Leptospiraceae bacterium]HMZ66810.1 hypothetical protein [Leptospiraceae bacterium]
MIKYFLTSFLIALSIASVSLSACDGKGKLVEDKPIEATTK